jgi:cysteine desulfurase
MTQVQHKQRERVARSTGDGVYLDHAATSPIRSEAWEAMRTAAAEADANPASTHAAGRRAQAALEEARSAIAGCLGVARAGLHFTGGGTQSDNLAILGFVRARLDASPRVLVSAIEHKAVIGAAERAEREGAEVHHLPVDRSGTIELSALEEALAAGSGRPTLVSIMWANNEIGTVQPLADVVELAGRYGASVHSDAVQAFGKIELGLPEVPVDMLTVTAHKIGGPVGIGALYLRSGVAIEPITYGGSQEQRLWPGTQNPVAAAGFAAAARLAVAELPERIPVWSGLRDRLAARLKEELANLHVHAEAAERRMPNLLNVGIPGVDRAAVAVGLDFERIAISFGSACSSGSGAASHVLEAIGSPVAGDGHAALRFSFGPETTAACIDRAADAVIRTIERLP